MQRDPSLCLNEPSAWMGMPCTPEAQSGLTSGAFVTPEAIKPLTPEAQSCLTSRAVVPDAPVMHAARPVVHPDGAALGHALGPSEVRALTQPLLALPAAVAVTNLARSFVRDHRRAHLADAVIRGTGLQRDGARVWGHAGWGLGFYSMRSSRKYQVRTCPMDGGSAFWHMTNCQKASAEA